MSQPDTTKELHKILPPANNWVKLTQQGHDELIQQLESYINNKVKEARIDTLEKVRENYNNSAIIFPKFLDAYINRLKSTNKELEK